MELTATGGRLICAVAGSPPNAGARPPALDVLIAERASSRYTWDRDRGDSPAPSARGTSDGAFESARALSDRVRGSRGRTHSIRILANQSDPNLGPHETVLSRPRPHEQAASATS